MNDKQIVLLLVGKAADLNKQYIDLASADIPNHRKRACWQKKCDWRVAEICRGPSNDWAGRPCYAD